MINPISVRPQGATVDFGSLPEGNAAKQPAVLTQRVSQAVKSSADGGAPWVGDLKSLKATRREPTGEAWTMFGNSKVGVKVDFEKAGVRKVRVEFTEGAARGASDIFAAMDLRKDGIGVDNGARFEFKFTPLQNGKTRLDFEAEVKSRENSGPTNVKRKFSFETKEAVKFDADGMIIFGRARLDPAGIEALIERSGARLPDRSGNWIP